MAQDRNLNIEYGQVADYTSQIRTKNDALQTTLENIKSEINSLEGPWESDASSAIRAKITGMQGRFEQYHQVVEQYAKFLERMVQEYKSTEATNTSEAEQFI